MDCEATPTVATHAGKPKQAAAVGTVLVEQPALELCCSQVQAGSHFYLAAVLRDGGLVVYRVAARPGAAGVQQELVAQAASSSKVFHVDVEESSSGSGTCCPVQQRLSYRCWGLRLLLLLHPLVGVLFCTVLPACLGHKAAG